jgi:hypothetical protein
VQINIVSPPTFSINRGQQVFYLKNAVDCRTDSRFTGELQMTRQAKNKRLYDMHISFSADGNSVIAAKYEIP